MRLSPETRTILIERFTKYAPQVLKSYSSRTFGLPLRPEVRRAGVIFIHVPKNAGTTIATQLYGRHIGHRSAEFYRQADPEFFASAPSFALVRDPVARFVSAYNFAKKGGSATVPASQHVTAFAQSFQTISECAACIVSMPERERARLDFVFRRQSDFTCDANGKVIVDKLIRLEAVSGGSFTIGGHNITMETRINEAQRTASPVEDGLSDILRAAYPRDFELHQDAT